MGSVIEDLVASINDFDPTAYIPDVNSLLGWAELFARICVLAAPILMLVIGMGYLLLPPKEANHIAGYRFYFGMGSVEAWRFTQKLAGFAWSALGLILTIVMLLIIGGFRKLDLMAVANRAAVCVVWELALMAVCCIAINVVLIIRFDRKGNRRAIKE